MIRSIFLLSFLLFFQSSCYKCPDGADIINPPSDISKPVFYPDSWSDGQPIPVLDQSASCLTTVKVPPGVYANVTFYRDFPTDSGSYVVYPNNKITRILNDDPHPFIFTSPQFKVNFQSLNSTGTYKFAFKIQYGKLPDVAERLINVDKGKPPVAVIPNTDLTVFIANSNSQISLIGFALTNSSQNYLLRQTAIFGGDSFNSEFIGTLDQVLYSKYPLTAHKNRLSVYTFGLHNYFDYPLFMGQDFQDTRGYILYQGVNCEEKGDCMITLDGSFGNSLTVTAHKGNDYVKEITYFPDTAVVNVYEGRVANTTFIESFEKDDYWKLLPLKVGGNMKFYELIGHGNCDMIVSRHHSNIGK